MVLPIPRGVRRAQVVGMKLPAHPKALAMLAAILPVMDRRTRRSAAWIVVTALSATFWAGLGFAVFLFLR